MNWGLLLIAAVPVVLGFFMGRSGKNALRLFGLHAIAAAPCGWMIATNSGEGWGAVAAIFILVAIIIPSAILTGLAIAIGKITGAKS